MFTCVSSKSRAEYQGRISALEEAMGSENEKETQSEVDKREEWKEREETLRCEMEAKYLEQVEEIQQECTRDKEAALDDSGRRTTD